MDQVKNAIHIRLLIGQKGHNPSLSQTDSEGYCFKTVVSLIFHSDKFDLLKSMMSY